MSELRRPVEWATALGFTIHDPDGWRHDRAKDFNEPITAAEFDERAIVCTVSFNHLTDWSLPFPKAVALDGGAR